MITPRLDMIISHIYASKVADIGTDHAYIPIYLAQNNLIEKAIATDLREGPLLIAKSNIEKYNLTEKIELRLGSGIAPIERGEVDTYIIAGMGGELISNILSADTEKAYSAETLVLQPMNAQDVLRKWLSENGFSIIEEDITTEEHKVYNLIIAKKGQGNTFRSEFELHLPPYLYSHKKFDSLKAKKKREFEKIRTGLLKANDKDFKLIEKYSEFLSEIERI